MFGLLMNPNSYYDRIARITANGRPESNRNPGARRRGGNS